MTVIAANAGRYPVSAQCEILGVARSNSMRSRAETPKGPDPIEPDVVAAHEASRGRYGARKIKAALARAGVTASRRRICRIMRDNGLASAYGRKKFECHPGRPNEAELPNVVARQFGGRSPRTHVCSDLTYVRVGGGWNYVCLLVDLYNREIVGHSAGPRKDADLVRAAFATAEPPFFRHPGFPCRSRRRIRQRQDRRDARSLRHRAVAPQEGMPATTRSTNRRTRS